MMKNVHIPELTCDIELLAFNFLKLNYRAVFSNSQVILQNILSEYVSYNEMADVLKIMYPIKSHEIEKIYYYWYDINYLAEMSPLFTFLNNYSLEKSDDLRHRITHNVTGEDLDLENDFMPYTSYNISEITNGILFWKALKKGVVF